MLALRAGGAIIAARPTRKDEPSFSVTLTIRLSTVVSFARGAGLDDNRIILPSDAIENAIGFLPEEVFDGFGGEFEIALPIDGEAVEL